MAAEKEPIWPEALFRRAHIAYLRANKWGAAEDAVKALELDPSLSRLFEQEGFTKKAVLSTLNSRACRQIEAKSFSLALPFLEAALKIDPLWTKFKKAESKGQFKGLDFESHIQHALETGFISPEEADQLIHYNVQRFDSMLTDIFDHELEQTLDLKNPYHTKASDIQP